MVGLSEALHKFGGSDIGKFPRVLHEQVLPDIRSACQGSRVSRAEIGSHDSYGIRG